MEKIEINDDTIYYVGCFDDVSVLLAINFTFNDDIQAVSWFDTIKYRGFPFDKVTYDRGEIKLYQSDTEENRTYTLTPLTLEIYNQKIRPNMLNKEEYKEIDKLYIDLKTSLENY